MNNEKKYIDFVNYLFIRREFMRFNQDALPDDVDLHLVKHGKKMFNYISCPSDKVKKLYDALYKL